MISKKPLLKNLQVLIADPDDWVSEALRYNMEQMGFGAIRRVRNGQEALAHLVSRPAHFVITEWALPQVDGLSLVQKVRKQVHGINPAMPIIMLSGRGEKQDVLRARDAGINEFIIKPFTSRAIFQRIERIVEYPRPFIISPGFNGPDRRFQSSFSGTDKRQRPPHLIHPTEATRAITAGVACMLPADYSVRQALGNTPLSQIITPQVLREAQAALDKMAGAGSEWVRADLEQLSQTHRWLQNGHDGELLERARATALSIKGRAGLAGFPLAGEVARMLYLFLSSHFRPDYSVHLQVMGKHIDVMKIVFAAATPFTDHAAAEIVSELQRLAVSA